MCAEQSTAKKRHKKINIQPYIFISPLFILFFVSGIYPLFYTIYLAFTQTVAGNLVFVGLKNFISVTKDRYFLTSCLNTVIFLVVDVNIKLVSSLGIALLLNKPFKGNFIAKFAMLLVWAAPYVACLWVWGFMLSPYFGVINNILLGLGIISKPIPFLSDPDIALYVITLIHVWKAIPFWSIMFLAGLTSIPVHLYESAVVDGANKFQTFRYITLPQLKNIIIINYVLTTIWTSGEFTSFQMLTNGGPFYRTATIPVYAYLSFISTWSYGVPSAALLFVFPFIAFLILAVLRTNMLTLGR
jgi:ABC-type sugar transport system permease subunit